MVARWISLAVGLWLVLCPLLLGYRSAAPILHDVIAGVLVSVAALAAIERPTLRFTVALPALWLLLAPRLMSWGSRTVTSVEIGSGAALLVLALVPGAKLASQRHPARMTA